MVNVSKSVQEKIEMACLQKQFGKDFHKLEFLFKIEYQEHIWLINPSCYNGKVLSVKWLKSPIAVRGVFDNSVVVSSQQKLCVDQETGKRNTEFTDVLIL